MIDRGHAADLQIGARERQHLGRGGVAVIEVLMSRPPCLHVPHGSLDAVCGAIDGDACVRRHRLVDDRITPPRTTFTRRRVSTPPRGPLTSAMRTVMRSIRSTNFARWRLMRALA